MEYRWTQIPPAPAALVDQLHHQLGINRSLCALLGQRGIEDFQQARSFFRPSLKMLHNPFLMRDMDKAVARIEKAMAAGERILIYGDYDVDGTTAVSLLFSFLRRHYSSLDTYIPDRYKEGYGISTAGIDYADDNGISLIIALDCGIKAIDKVEYARQKNIDFIICDHHRPGDTIPKAAAVLNPKRRDCIYPYDELSGCGVGFKLVQALCQKWRLNDDEWTGLLDLLAISIGADIVPITGENRVLTYFGLKLINSKPRLGIRLLKEISGRSDKDLSITDVVFTIGPRINAAGRISHGHLAVELLSSENEEEVGRLCQQINDHNQERKELDSSITESALQMIRELKEEERYTTVVYNQNWHKGVIGIVASRLIENYYRPTVVFTESNGILAGSARSVKDFDVYEALNACTDILDQFGGHMYAAGMTLKKERFEDFKNHFEAVVKDSIREEQRLPQVDIDLKVKLNELNPKFFRILRQMAPFGPGNMDPVFQSDQLVDAGSRVVGNDKSHLRVVLREPASGCTLTGIGFGMADKIDLLKSGSPVSVCYHLDENEFRGVKSLQLRLKDIKLSNELN